MTQQLCGETTCDDTLAQGRTCMSPKVLQSMRHWFSPQQHRTRSMLEFVHTHNEYVVQHGVERVNNRHVCHIFTARMGPRFSLQYNLYAMPKNKNFSVRPDYWHSMCKIYFQNFISRYSTLNTNFKSNGPRLPPHRNISEMPGIISCNHHNGFVETTACRGTQNFIPHVERIAGHKTV